MNKEYRRTARLPLQALSRRDFLCRSCNGIGALALAGMLAEELPAGTPAPAGPPLPHSGRKAKHCIFMFMAGGVSHVDSFDYKPALQDYAGRELPPLSGLSGEIKGYLDKPHRVIPSAFEFKRYGQSDRAISTLFPRIGQCADDLAFVYGIEVENNNHGPATMHVTTGSQFQGSASVGSWVTYGLGSPNRNLPGYMVIQDPRGAPVNGAAVWGSGYLPAAYQGTVLRSSGTPILHLDLPRGLDRAQQRREFDLLHFLNSRHLDQRPGASELEARISAYELAYRMQASAPEAVDLSGESAHTRRLYGLDNPVTEGFGRQCLLARRMVERGVRYSLLVHGVEINKHSWDDHSNVEGRMRNHAAEVDLPVAGLLQDLKQRGLLEETLVVWASEMGRTPFVNDLKSKTPGRDHNQFALVMWLAGGRRQGRRHRRGHRRVRPQGPGGTDSPAGRTCHHPEPAGAGRPATHLPPWRALPPLDRHRRPRAPRDHRLTHPFAAAERFRSSKRNSGPGRSWCTMGINAQRQGKERNDHRCFRHSDGRPPP